MKYFLVISAVLFLNLTQNYSQLKDTSNHFVYCGTDIDPAYIDWGNSIAGPCIGYSLKSKIFSYGLNYEYAFAQSNTGIYSVGIKGKFSTGKEDVLENTAKLKTQNISAGIQCNYNFYLSGIRKVIPFAGVVLGYNYSLTTYNFNNGISNPMFPDTRKHSLYIYGQAGFRFFISHNAAITIKGGTGNIDKSILEAGFDLLFYIQ